MKQKIKLDKCPDTILISNNANHLSPHVPVSSSKQNRNQNFTQKAAFIIPQVPSKCHI